MPKVLVQPDATRPQHVNRKCVHAPQPSLVFASYCWLEARAACKQIHPGVRPQTPGSQECIVQSAQRAASMVIAFVNPPPLTSCP
jgi:hypothetical protein